MNGQRNNGKVNKHFFSLFNERFITGDILVSHNQQYY